MIYRQVIPFRSVFETKGKSTHTTQNERRIPGPFVRAPPPSDHLNVKECIRFQPPRHSDETIDDTQYVEVFELWHRAQDMAPKLFSSSNEANSNSSQNDNDTARIIEVDREDIEIVSNVDEAAPDSSSHPEATKRKHFNKLGWWVCCQDCREVNSSVWGESCPDCSHSRCYNCILA